MHNRQNSGPENWGFSLIAANKEKMQFVLKIISISYSKLLRKITSENQSDT